VIIQHIESDILQVDKRLDRMDKYLEQVDRCLDRMDKHLKQVDKRLDRMDKHLPFELRQEIPGQYFIRSANHRDYKEAAENRGNSPRFFACG